VACQHAGAHACGRSNPLHLESKLFGGDGAPAPEPVMKIYMCPEDETNYSKYARAGHPAAGA
jgi:hypothetical protein